MCQFVAYWNRTWKSNIPPEHYSISHIGCFDYITTHKEMNYMWQFQEILQKGKQSEDDYKPEDYLA